tara:strand:- start:550 stop:810 length:261 start_codon:yes stop_codon:yes gene_type:complete
MCVFVGPWVPAVKNMKCAPMPRQDSGNPVGILTKDGMLCTIGAISAGSDGTMVKRVKVEGPLFGNVLIPKKVTVDGKEHKLKKEMM